MAVPKCIARPARSARTHCDNANEKQQYTNALVENKQFVAARGWTERDMADAKEVLKVRAMSSIQRLHRAHSRRAGSGGGKRRALRRRVRRGRGADNDVRIYCFPLCIARVTSDFSSFTHLAPLSRCFTASASPPTPSPLHLPKPRSCSPCSTTGAHPSLTLSPPLHCLVPASFSRHQFPPHHLPERPPSRKASPLLETSSWRCVPMSK
jgi:hypothetical protein